MRKSGLTITGLLLASSLLFTNKPTAVFAAGQPASGEMRRTKASSPNVVLVIADQLPIKTKSSITMWDPNRILAG